MVRSLYSGVSGMMAQQTKMDVIGNNISNVGTYGYKHTRATFQDVYYQTKEAANSATATEGGKNATQIGYGSRLASIDVNTAQSMMTTTGYAMDCAITGEGYFQVMDSDGNIFYTRAGMFDIDANGNLVDINGYFVLGTQGYPSTINSGTTPRSDKITITLPYEDHSTSKASATINGKNITISSSNANKAGNISMSITSTAALPIGQKASATITSTSIAVKLNAAEKFASLDELQSVINAAIKQANGGAAHEAGDFIITIDDDSNFEDGLTGAEIAGQNFGVNPGTVELAGEYANYCTVKSVGDKFTGVRDNSAAERPDISFSIDTGATGDLTIKIGAYTGVVPAEQLKASSGTVLMKRTTPANSDEADSFVMTYPSYAAAQKLVTGGSAQAKMTPTKPSNDLGLQSTVFNLTTGTEGGEQTVANLTGIAINSGGVITGIHPTLGILELGRIDLATFQNPAGLTQEGNTYFAKSANSGEPKLTVPGENGSGAIAAGTLEASNVDLSQEFSDMIVTQRAFQACSRVITVTDTMLEELINLKR